MSESERLAAAFTRIAARTGQYCKKCDDTGTVLVKGMYGDDEYPCEPCGGFSRDERVLRALAEATATAWDEAAGHHEAEFFVRAVERLADTGTESR